MNMQRGPHGIATGQPPATVIWDIRMGSVGLVLSWGLVYRSMPLQR